MAASVDTTNKEMQEILSLSPSQLTPPFVFDSLRGPRQYKMHTIQTVQFNLCQKANRHKEHQWHTGNLTCSFTFLCPC